MMGRRQVDWAAVLATIHYLVITFRVASMGNAMRRHCSKRNRHRNCDDFIVNHITPDPSRRSRHYTSEDHTDHTITKSSITGEVSNASVNSSSSWVTTLGTRSDFSLSLPTGESESSESEISTSDSRNEIESELHTSDEDDQRSRTISSESIHSSDTSADFSSFKPLSQLSEHSMVRLRDEDIEWAEAVRRYHSAEPVFHRPAIKAALKVRPRRIKPQLSWRRCFHQWAVRQRPEEYRGFRFIAFIP
uniref:Uncharacterized protein n=1 Tax=Ascaris lumbricoides TaxID=6252 RepID=A0A9J2PNT1_ASCLU